MTSETNKGDCFTLKEIDATKGTPDLELIGYVQSFHDLFKERMEGVSFTSKSKTVKATRYIQSDVECLLNCTKDFDYFNIIFILVYAATPTLTVENIQKCFKNTKKDREEKVKALKLFAAINKCLLGHIVKK